MRAINIVKYGRFPLLNHHPIQSPAPAEVRIRMKYAPVNPSDINFFQGRYGVRKPLEATVGFQGSGVVEFGDEKLIGKKVSVIANYNNGTHCTHMIGCNPKELIVWPDSADLKLISMAWINPFSCLGLIEAVKNHQPENVLLSAAASQLSFSIVKSLKDLKKRVKIYGMTRSDQKNDQLLDLGVEKVFPIHDDRCEGAKEISGRTVFLDCVGGNFAGRVFNSLPAKSLMINFGKLSGQPLGEIDLGELYYRDKHIKGFWLNNWLQNVSNEELQQHKQTVILNMEEVFAQKVREVVPMKDFMDGYRLAIKDQSEGKILLDLE